MKLKALLLNLVLPSWSPHAKEVAFALRSLSCSCFYCFFYLVPPLRVTPGLAGVVKVVKQRSPVENHINNVDCCAAGID